jgi:hypothetical protein
MFSRLYLLDDGQGVGFVNRARTFL